MDLSVRQIRAFVTVATLGSFTRAATALHISQPALTVQLRNLEESLGSRLLDRNSRGVWLTRIGGQLLPLLQRSLADLDSIVEDAYQLGGAGTGTVRIAALPSFAASLLPDLILACRRDALAPRFVVKDAVASNVNVLVSNEEVDMGITGGEVSDAEFDIVGRAKDRLCLVYPSGHAIGARRRVTVKELADLPLVLTAAGTSVRAVVDAAFIDAKRTPSISCEPIYMMTAVAMVKAGLGFTILPGSSPEIHAVPSLASRPIDDPAFVRPIALIKKKGRTLPAASAAFLDQCAAALAALKE